jgi:hypothetical protein
MAGRVKPHGMHSKAKNLTRCLNIFSSFCSGYFPQGYLVGVAPARYPAKNISTGDAKCKKRYPLTKENPNLKK